MFVWVNTLVCKTNCPSWLQHVGHYVRSTDSHIHTNTCLVTDVKISVLVNELRGLKWGTGAFSSLLSWFWRDTVKRQFITSGELGLSWHPCQECGGMEMHLPVFVCVSWLPGGWMPRQLQGVWVSACGFLLMSLWALKPGTHTHFA